MWIPALLPNSLGITVSTSPTSRAVGLGPSCNFVKHVIVGSLCTLWTFFSEPLTPRSVATSTKVWEFVKLIILRPERSHRRNESKMQCVTTQLEPERLEESKGRKGEVEAGPDVVLGSEQQQLRERRSARIAMDMQNGRRCRVAEFASPCTGPTRPVCTRCWESCVVKRPKWQKSVAQEDWPACSTCSLRLFST